MQSARFTSMRPGALPFAFMPVTAAGSRIASSEIVPVDYGLVAAVTKAFPSGHVVMLIVITKNS